MVKSWRKSWRGRAYGVFVAVPEAKRSLRRPTRSWDDNIKIDLEQLEWEDVYRINMAHERDQWQTFVKTVMNVRFQ
jgi:hypothetical protein